ncbi:MAG: hypothetical protein KDE50_24240, partial [Caldilineaceae bacterium]|nr:hypothetical protein [Caldilineaceae bacterium]
MRTLKGQEQNPRLTRKRGLNGLTFSRCGGFSLPAAGFVRCDYQVRECPVERVDRGEQQVEIGSRDGNVPLAGSHG